jgi:hypothetical protein
MMFQLWDEESANLLGSYSTEDAALSIVRDVVEKHGREAIDAILLIRDDTEEQLTEIASGVALVDLALARTSPAA